MSALSLLSTLVSLFSNQQLFAIFCLFFYKFVTDPKKLFWLPFIAQIEILVQGYLSYNYTMRFIGYDSIQTADSYLLCILSLSNSHNSVASIRKNRGDKSHRVIVALG